MEHGLLNDVRDKTPDAIRHLERRLNWLDGFLETHPFPIWTPEWKERERVRTELDTLNRDPGIH